MSIDIQKAKRAFKEYVKNYDPNDPQIKLKIEHIERTANVARNTAESLDLSQEDIQLAELIGLLHDIGRFEQIKMYHTFVDKKSINHGEFGVKILFEEGLIRKFIEDNKFDKIIKNAILNHNKANIDERLTEKEKLHAKIIRDSDKTSTIYGVEDLSNETITDEIYREFIEDKMINYKNMETEADILVAHFAYVYDFYFDYGLKILQKNDYVKKLYNRYNFSNQETMERYNNVYNCTLQYLENRLKLEV